MSTHTLSSWGTQSKTRSEACVRWQEKSVGFSIFIRRWQSTDQVQCIQHQSTNCEGCEGLVAHLSPPTGDHFISCHEPTINLQGFIKHGRDLHPDLAHTVITPHRCLIICGDLIPPVLPTFCSFNLPSPGITRCSKQRLSAQVRAL